jgi:hypothetical protein
MRDQKTGQFIFNGGKKSLLRDKLCPHGCGRFIMRKSSSCRSCHQLGEKGPRWRGDNAKYSALHKWIVKEQGRAQWCTWCFSCVKVEWANVSHEYKREINDWMQLCRNCHKKYDSGVNRGLATIKFPELRGGVANEFQ